MIYFPSAHRAKKSVRPSHDFSCSSYIAIYLNWLARTSSSPSSAGGIMLARKGEEAAKEAQEAKNRPFSGINKKIFRHPDICDILKVLR